MTSAQKVSGGFLKFITCLRIVLVLNNRSIVHFCRWCGVRRGSKNWSLFCEHHKWMTPNLSGLMNLAVMLDPKHHDPGHPKIHGF